MELIKSKVEYLNLVWAYREVRMSVGCACRLDDVYRVLYSRGSTLLTSGCILFSSRGFLQLWARHVRVIPDSLFWLKRGVDGRELGDHVQPSSVM